MRNGFKDLLNRAMPLFGRMMFGNLVDEMIRKHNSLLEKLDADAGVAATDYAASLRIKTLDQR